MTHQVRDVIGIVLIGLAVATLVISFVVWRRLRRPSAMRMVRMRVPDRAAQREVFSALRRGSLLEDPVLREVTLEAAQLTLEQFDPTIIYASVVVLFAGEYLIRASTELIVVGVLYLVIIVFSVISRRQLKASSARILATARGEGRT